jgi:hypothetical protein
LEIWEQGIIKIKPTETISQLFLSALEKKEKTKNELENAEIELEKSNE